jgi:hypothetical protein
MEGGMLFFSICLYHFFNHSLESSYLCNPVIYPISHQLYVVGIGSGICALSVVLLIGKRIPSLSINEL